MSLAAHVATLGRGPGRSRSLTMAEADEAMALMLSGAAPEAVGAVLMLMRMKGETAEEIAGFARAAQAGVSGLPRADLDWPSYAAGRTRGLPWFLLSARLVAQAGHRVVLHGWNGADATVRNGLEAAGIPLATTAPEAAAALAAHRIVYLPLERVHPALFALLSLRDTFGLRSCVNTVCRMLNPARADASVQGVFHPSYRLVQADAGLHLGWRNLCVIKGGGGEFERHPGKPVTGFGLRCGMAFEEISPALATVGGRLAEGPGPGVDLAGLWSGAQRDPFAEAVVVGTAALALETLGKVGKDGAAAQGQAQALWNSRAKSPRKGLAA